MITISIGIMLSMSSAQQSEQRITSHRHRSAVEFNVFGSFLMSSTVLQLSLDTSQYHTYYDSHAPLQIHSTDVKLRSGPFMAAVAPKKCLYRNGDSSPSPVSTRFLSYGSPEMANIHWRSGTSRYCRFSRNLLHILQVNRSPFQIVSSPVYQSSPRLVFASVIPTTHV